MSDVINTSENSAAGNDCRMETKLARKRDKGIQSEGFQGEGTQSSKTLR